MIHCAHCGCLLVGEIKKKKYIYYHCTGNKGGDCKKKYLKEEIINASIDEILKNIQVTDEEIKEIIATIKEINHFKDDISNLSIDDITKQIKVLKNRLSRAYDDYTDGKITDEFYKEKSLKWQGEIRELEITLTAINKTDEQFYIDCTNILELAKNAHKYYNAGTIEQKQKILKLLCSNFLWDGENLHIYLNSAFECMLKNANLEKIWGGRIRTSECLDQNQVPYHLATPHYRLHLLF